MAFQINQLNNLDYDERAYLWPGMIDPNLTLGDFQLFLQPYFPDWQQCFFLTWWASSRASTVQCSQARGVRAIGLRSYPQNLTWLIPAEESVA